MLWIAKQVGRDPLFDDLALLHHEDQIGVPDRRQPVRDHEARAVGTERGHRLLQQQLGPRVDRAGGLIQDKQRRPL